MIRIPLLLVGYFSIATVLAEAGLFAAIALKGGMDRERVFQLLAVAQDVDLFTMWNTMLAKARPMEEEHVSHREVVERRKRVSLDLDLKEMGAEKGLRDIRQLQRMLTQERERYEQVKQNYEYQRDRVRQGAIDESLLDTQRQLQAMQSKLAKDQIIRILDDESVDSEASLLFVVTIIKAMPLEKRKKILAEFKSDVDTERLHEILRRIRLGVPDVQLIRDTRAQLEQFKSRK